MKRTLVSLLSLLAIALVTLASCSEPNNNPDGSTAKSISVKVVDAMNAKTISPTGNVDVSHYKIYIQNEAEGITYVSAGASSDYLAKNESFTVSNVPSGIWKAKVEAYVKNNDSYILVGSAESDEKRVEVGEEATLLVTLDTLDDSLSGDITVVLDMPAELDDNGDTFYYTYKIAGTGQRSDYSYSMDTPTKGTVDSSGNGRFVIDASGIDEPLYQGAYLLTVTVFDQNTQATSAVVRKGVEIMRLVNGLAASGEINLDSQIISEEGFQVAITDKIGNKLDLGAASFDSFASDMTITVNYNTVPVSTPVTVYVDGEKVDFGTDYTATPGSGNVAYKFLSMDGGRHIVTFILDESDTQLGVGSLSVEVNVPVKIEFAPLA